MNSETVRQKLDYPRIKQPITAQQCATVQCRTNAPSSSLETLNSRRMVQNRANSSGQESAVHLHVKIKGHSFEDSFVDILYQEDRWFERGLKEANC